ncbi:hypothetical protein [Brevundimonas diminuta]
MTDENNAPDEGDDKAVPDEALEALKANNARLLKEAQDARKKARDAEAALAAKQAEEEAKAAEAATEAKDIEALRTQLETKHARELKSATDRAERAEGQVQRLVIDTGLSTALDDARVKPELKKAATAMLREGVELRDDDEGGPAAYKGGLPLSEAIKLWADSDEGKAFIMAGNSGGGAPGGGKGAHSGPNPWKLGPTFNLTDQDRIEREKPELAARLKAEAGAA